MKTAATIITTTTTYTWKGHKCHWYHYNVGCTETQAIKCSNHHTISLIAHTAKIIAKILRRRIERKIEALLGEDQFGFRRGKGTRDAIGMMRIIAK